MDSLPIKARLLRYDQVVKTSENSPLKALICGNVRLKIEVTRPIVMRGPYRNKELFFFFETATKEIQALTFGKQTKTDFHYYRKLKEHEGKKIAFPPTTNICTLCFDSRSGFFEIWQVSIPDQCDMYFFRTQKIAHGRAFRDTKRNIHIHGLEFYPNIHAYMYNLEILASLPVTKSIPPRKDTSHDRSFFENNVGEVVFWSEADGRGIIKGQKGYAVVYWEDLEGSDFRYLLKGQFIGFKNWHTDVLTAKPYRGCTAKVSGIVNTAGAKPDWQWVEYNFPKGLQTP